MLQIFKPFRFLPKQSIETKANEILWQMQQTKEYRPASPLDTSRVAEFLGLDVLWDKIPEDEDGVIAARILPLERLIEINEEILELGEGFSESTLAHEIGHWVLHIDSQGVDQVLREYSPGQFIEIEPFLCRNEMNFRGMEWQAQYFASCLLMPTSSLKKVIQGLDLTRWRHLYQIAETMGVTISNLVHRLKDLGWIEIEPTSKTKRHAAFIVLGSGNNSPSDK